MHAFPPIKYIQKHACWHCTFVAGPHLLKLVMRMEVGVVAAQHAQHAVSLRRRRLPLAGIRPKHGVGAPPRAGADSKAVGLHTLQPALPLGVQRSPAGVGQLGSRGICVHPPAEAQLAHQRRAHAPEGAHAALCKAAARRALRRQLHGAHPLRLAGAGIGVDAGCGGRQRILPPRLHLPQAAHLAAHLRRVRWVQN